jgi:hypothetical protein
MGRPRWTPGRIALPFALGPTSIAADHSVRTLFVVGGILFVVAVIAIVLGVWGGGRRRK